MEISRWSVEDTRGQMVRATRDEALKLIESLSRQLRTGNANDGRAEFTAGIAGTKTEEYFSIVVAGCRLPERQRESEIEVDRA